MYLSLSIHISTYIVIHMYVRRYEEPMPRAPLQPCPRFAKALEDKKLAADVVVYGAAVGAMTCMEEGAIAAQPSRKLADKFAQVGPVVVRMP